MTNYVVLDLETSMRQRDERGKSGSDPLKGDVILTIGLKYRGGGKNPSEHFLQALSQDYMPKGWLQGIDLIIAHNACFDLKFIWRNDELQDFFKNGGRIWDTQLVEYILSGQRHKYPALRDIATNKYGCAERIKHIEGRNTEEVPIELLLEDVRNDVLDTEVIALAQAKQAKKEGMMGLLKTQMDARLCTIEMEINGFQVDKEILQANQKELEEQLNPLLEEIAGLAKKYWPEELEFNIQSPKQLVQLFFGGEYKVKVPKPILEEVNGLIQEVLIKSGPNKGQVKTKLEEEVRVIEGLGIKAHKDWKTPSGAVSVNEKVLKELSKGS